MFVNSTWKDRGKVLLSFYIKINSHIWVCIRTGVFFIIIEKFDTLMQNQSPRSALWSE